MKRVFKWLAVLFGVFLILCVVGVVAAYLLIDLDEIKEQIATEASNATGKEVTIGDIGLSFFPTIGVTIDDVVLANGPGYDSELLARVDSGGVSVAFWPLLSQEFEVAGIYLTAPKVWIEEMADGSYSFEPPKPDQKAPSAETPSEEPTPGATTPPPSPTTPAAPGEQPEPQGDPLADLREQLKKVRIAEIAVTDAEVYYLPYAGDGVQKPVIGVLENFNVEIQDLELGKALRIAMDATPMGFSEAGVKVDGTIGPVPESLNYLQIPADITLTIDRFAFEELAKDFPLPVLDELQGAFATTLRLEHVLGEAFKLTGQGGVSRFTRAGTGAEPWEADYTVDVSYAYAANNATITAASLNLGRTKFIAEGGVNAVLTNPQFDLTLRGQPLYVADLLRGAQFASALTGAPLEVPLKVGTNPGNAVVTLRGNASEFATTGDINLTPLDITVPGVFVKGADEELFARWDVDVKVPGGNELIPVGLVDVQEGALNLLGTRMELQGKIDSANGLVDIALTSTETNLARLFKAMQVEIPGGGDPITGPTTLSASLTGDFGRIDLASDVSFEQNALNLPGIVKKPAGTPLGFKLNGSLGNDTLTLSDASVRVGKIWAKLKGAINDFDDQRQMDLELSTSTVDFGELGKLIDTSTDDVAPALQWVRDLLEMYTSRDIRGRMTASASLRGPAMAAGPESVPRADIRIDGLSLSDPALPKRLKRLDARLEKKGNALAVSSFGIKIGDSDLSGNFTLSDFVNWKRAQYDVNLASDKLVLTDVLHSGEDAAAEPAAPAPGGEAAPPEASATGADPLVPDFAKTMTARGKVAIDQFLAYGYDIRDIKGQMNLERGQLDFTDLKMRVFDGQFDGKAQIDLNQDPIAYEFDSQLQRLNVQSLMNSVSPFQDVLLGMLSSNMDLQGAGHEWEMFKKTWEGQGQLSLKDAKIGGLNILAELEPILALFGPEFVEAAKKAERFDDLDLSWTIKDGTISNNDIQATQDYFTVTGRGNTDFDLNMDYDLRVRFTPEVTSLIQSKVRLPANMVEEGRFVVPIELSGAMQRPKVKLKVDLVEMLAGGTLEDLKQQGREKLEEEAGKLLEGLFGN